MERHHGALLHMDMAPCTDEAFFEVQGAFGTDQRNGGGPLYPSGTADWRVDPQTEFVGSRYFDLAFVP